MIKSKQFVLLNSVTLVLMLWANYISATGLLSGVTVSDVSHKYDTLFAPAGYAFSIWSLIFLLCIAFDVYQWFLLKNGDSKAFIQRTGWWFIISNLANAGWLYCWTQQMIGWSVILILLLLFCLCMLTIRLRLELDDEPVRTILFIWWPIAIYLGWVMVATIACIASWFVSIGWRGGTIGEELWTIIMVGVAGILYLLLVRSRNLRESAAVGIWAFIAIATRQWNNHSHITISAIVAAAVLLVAVTIHAYQNRHYTVAAKIKRKEWK